MIINPRLVQQYRQAIENPDAQQSKLAMVELCDALDIRPGSSEAVDLREQLRAAGWTGAAILSQRSPAEIIGAQHAKEASRSRATFSGAAPGTTARSFRDLPINPLGALDANASSNRYK
jgi:hypothetical protein